MSPLPGKDLLVTVTESFEHTQRISECLEPCCPNPASFHYPKYFQSQMQADMPKSQWSCGVQGGVRGWCEGLGQMGCQTSPSAPLTDTPLLPALLLWRAQEDRPCQPAPGVPHRWPGRDPACGEGLVWEGAPEQLCLELLWQGGGKSPGDLWGKGPSGRIEASGGVGEAELQWSQECVWRPS